MVKCEDRTTTNNCVLVCSCEGGKRRILIFICLSLGMVGWGWGWGARAAQQRSTKSYPHWLGESRQGGGGVGRAKSS